MSGLTFSVVIDVLGGAEEEFLSLVNAVIDRMRCEDSFISATLGADARVPSRFHLFEQWADRTEFLEVQVGRDYRKPYEERVGALLKKPRRVTEWRELRSEAKHTRS